MVKDKGTSSLTLGGLKLNIKRNASLGWWGVDYLLYRWLPGATTAIFGANGRTAAVSLTTTVTGIKHCHVVA